MDKDYQKFQENKQPSEDELRIALEGEKRRREARKKLQHQRTQETLGLILPFISKNQRPTS